MKTEYTKLVDENDLKSLGSKLSDPKTGMKAYIGQLSKGF